MAIDVAAVHRCSKTTIVLDLFTFQPARDLTAASRDSNLDDQSRKPARLGASGPPAGLII
ncbi:MAG: hypothetical protein JOY90_30130 [Bradyrhizobium sp.]|uniref:hypothetical protein n=1 Tax=Bradyrhizobium sp. TaxID=376 RepID=UPI001D96CD35|nr:hypothetical protein [Bradyrhizobium sp.]MBV9564671.1 hypothetical protein [Bradyrhizobium sp.]